VESYRAAPRAKSDARRAPEPAAEDATEEAPGGASDDGDFDDIAAWMKDQAVAEPETAT
jgi:hypothetical protein